MQFIKMQGAGNDYVYVDCLGRPAPLDPSRLAVSVSDRHFGIGADGLILIDHSIVAHARMKMWNADGSAGETCGNGLRCVARYLFESGRVPPDDIRIETKSCVVSCDMQLDGRRILGVSVGMGEPILHDSQIPTTLEGNPPLDVELLVEDRRFTVSSVSMGNPHCVIFAETWSDEDVMHFGPLIEHHLVFPQRTNVEFVELISPDECRVKVWERGSGRTLACGSGACAVTVAGVLSGRFSRRVLCHMDGGDLRVEWKEGGTVRLTGPAEEVFRGEWPD